jgi:hypothetical protein
MGDFTQRDDESAAEWLARVQKVGLGGLSREERLSLIGSEQEARGQAAQERREAEAPPRAGPAPLGQAKDAFRRLGPGDRQQFILWLAQGAPAGD